MYLIILETVYKAHRQQTTLIKVQNHCKRLNNYKVCPVRRLIGGTFLCDQVNVFHQQVAQAIFTFFDMSCTPTFWRGWVWREGKKERRRKREKRLCLLEFKNNGHEKKFWFLFTPLTVRVNKHYLKVKQFSVTIGVL